VTNVSCRGCIRSPMGDSWADGTAVRGAPPLREEVVRSKRTRKGKESTRSSLSQSIAHRGLAVRPGSCCSIAGSMPEPAEME
jgi:hypothetical protein